MRGTRTAGSTDRERFAQVHAHAQDHDDDHDDDHERRNVLLSEAFLGNQPEARTHQLHEREVVAGGLRLRKHRVHVLHAARELTNRHRVVHVVYETTATFSAATFR